jgi:predicted ester cyclase
MTAVPGVGGRDISQILAPQGQRRQAMPGFDEDYADIVDYILRCTHRIWEQKDIGLIATHYAPDIVVHTMTGPVHGMAGVIAGTARTLSAFPDRTLVGEAVIWSDEGEGTYLSSHRITSSATNLGTSELGPPTGKRISFTTIADCLCRENLIVEEWLVRDYSAMALGLGYAPRSVARELAKADRSKERPTWRDEAMEAVRSATPTTFPKGTLPGTNEPEAFARAVLDRIVNHRRLATVRDIYSPAAHWSGPGTRRLFGWGEITGWYTALIGSFGNAYLTVDHVAAVEGEWGQDIAVRWRLAGTHDGPALYGSPSEREIFILAVTHWRVLDGKIIDEVTVFDEVALLRQIEGGL